MESIAPAMGQRTRQLRGVLHRGIWINQLGIAILWCIFWKSVILEFLTEKLNLWIGKVSVILENLLYQILPVCTSESLCIFRLNLI